MYLEISARQTGKTTRLVQEVLFYSSIGRQCIVFAPNNAMARILENMYKKMNRINDAYSVAPRFYSNVCTYRRGCIGFSDSSEHFYFYDEVDLFPGEVIVSGTGYYVTTAKRLRTLEDIRDFVYGKKNDNLLKLISACDTKIVSCTFRSKVEYLNKKANLIMQYGDIAQR